MRSYTTLAAMRLVPASGDVCIAMSDVMPALPSPAHGCASHEHALAFVLVSSPFVSSASDLVREAASVLVRTISSLLLGAVPNKAKSASDPVREAASVLVHTISRLLLGAVLNKA